jgi:hypothetical protein
MENEHRKNFYLVYIFIFVITFIVTALTFISYRIPQWLMLFSFILVIAGICFLWLRKLSKTNLYLNNLLNLLISNIIAYFLTSYLIISQDRIMGFIIGIVAMDVFSFTKRGKNTLNAKLTGNINTMARLSICLPIPGSPGLQQIIGVGDILYYSTITMYFIKSSGTLSGLYAVMIILIGQFINIIAILVLNKYQQEKYKGFPATLFPGMFIFIVSVFRLI